MMNAWPELSWLNSVPHPHPPQMACEKERQTNRFPASLENHSSLVCAHEVSFKIRKNTVVRICKECALTPWLNSMIIATVDSLHLTSCGTRENFDKEKFLVINNLGKPRNLEESQYSTYKHGNCKPLCPCYSTRRIQNSRKCEHQDCTGWTKTYLEYLC